MTTSKTKGTNAKIKELKGIKPEKVSENHLTEIQGAVSEINKIYLELGRITSTQHNYLHDLAGKQDKLTLLQSTLKDEYGTDDINIQDGSINYPKENGEVNKKD